MYKMIGIKPETHARLEKRMAHNDTFDSFINKLLDCRCRK